MLIRLFRHGNRTVDTHELYEKDPYVNMTYPPMGRGALTNFGKQRLYKLGTALRERYGSLLGDYYLPSEVEAQSTNYKRAKCSLMLVSAGLFVPKKDQIWSQELLWQPIPYEYRSIDNDEILNGYECPNFHELYKEQSHKQKVEFQKYGTITDYISKHTGEDINSFKDIYNLYFGLSTESEFGLKLPRWTKPVWPEVITHLATKYYYSNTATTEMKRFAAGFFIKKMINDTRNKLRGVDDTKIYLYSGHETNIAHTLILLDNFISHIPTYTSYLAFEVHKMGDNKYGLKIVYEDYSSDTPRVLKLHNCDSICPIDTFETLVRDYLPTNERCKG